MRRIAAVSVCGPLDRMIFDHRMAGPVRTTAVRIWRNYDDGDEIRVQPILQQSRPTARSRVAIRVNLDPEIAALLPALNDGFPRVETMSAPQLRAVIRERAQCLQNPEPVARVVDRTVPGPAGDISVRIYWPTASSRIRCRSSCLPMGAASCSATWTPMTTCAVP